MRKVNNEILDKAIFAANNAKDEDDFIRKEEAAIRFKNAELCLRFIREVPNAEAARHLEVIARYGNTNICRDAFAIKGVDMVEFYNNAINYQNFDALMLLFEQTPEMKEVRSKIDTGRALKVIAAVVVAQKMDVDKIINCTRVAADDGWEFNEDTKNILSRAVIKYHNINKVKALAKCIGMHYMLEDFILGNKTTNTVQ